MRSASNLNDANACHSGSFGGRTFSICHDPHCHNLSSTSCLRFCSYFRCICPAFLNPAARRCSQLDAADFAFLFPTASDLSFICYCLFFCPSCLLNCCIAQFVPRNPDSVMFRTYSLMSDPKVILLTCIGCKSKATKSLMLDTHWASTINGSRNMEWQPYLVNECNKRSRSEQSRELPTRPGCPLVSLEGEGLLQPCSNHQQFQRTTHNHRCLSPEHQMRTSVTSTTPLLLDPGKLSSFR